jgi:hypothetical protein
MLAAGVSTDLTFDLTRQSADVFQTFGFVVLRRFFEPGPLAAEIDRVMADGPGADVSRSGDIRFQYVPMMTAETPVSLSLLDPAEIVAAGLLGGPVLPTRAKGVRYFGDTPWHTDSDSALTSVGFLAYLEPVGADSGALRVLPGSHHPQLGGAIRALGTAGLAALTLPYHVVATERGTSSCSMSTSSMRASEVELADSGGWTTSDRQWAPKPRIGRRRTSPIPTHPIGTEATTSIDTRAMVLTGEARIARPWRS